MDMDSSRRSLDRSREPGMKKPRLTDELERGPNSSARPFPQRQAASGVTMLASARFRTNDRDSESSDSVRGGYQPQQPGLHQELVTQYKTALAELTFNSKPIITNLTIIAGENLHAAKAIAATVCANILEVPSEQKLPSLYLLDSIVKNIGRDYIKYFAARIPEVFCKAYNHVDPSVHSSMRHLFGTWRGVFPPQTLQMIEKELGFSPTVNGSSSTSSTLKSDTQSQRPPHSIHVNPRYLERQRLQQSNQTKGIAKDMTGAIANSTEDSERPDRALTAGRPWVGPAVNMRRSQQSQRDAFNDTVPEKNIGVSYGGKESGSELPRNLGLGVGRASGMISELGHGYKAGSDIVETMSGQRNGFIINHGISNHEAPKSTGIRSNVMSTSWKNSEEEEFMWEDMNAGLTDPVAPKVSSNLSKDCWTADDENLADEDQLRITHPFGVKVARDASTKKKPPPAFGHRSSLSWQLQEEHSIDEPNCLPGHSEGFTPTVNGLSTSANSSVVRTGNRPFLRNAAVGNLHHPPHQLRNLAEQDHSKAPKTSPFSGGLQSQYIQDSSPLLLPKAQVGNLQRSQQKDLQGPLSLPSVTSFQLKHHNAVSQQQLLATSESEVSTKTEKQSESKVSLPGEISEQSTTSSLLAAVMKSGILSNNSITSSLPNLNFLDKKILPSQSGVKPSQAGGSSTTLTSAGAGGALPSSLGPSPNNDLSTPKIPQGKVGQPLRLPAVRSASSTISTASAAQTSNATNNSSNPISNLLSSLVAKGLISANSESPTKFATNMLTRLEDQSQSIATSTSSPVASDPGSAVNPASSTGDEVDHPAKSSVGLSQPTTTEIRNLIGFVFKPDVIRKLHPPVISELFEDFPHYCSICGLRLKYQEQLDRHLEWHATRDREQNGLIRASRKWYVKSSSWIAGKAKSEPTYKNNDSEDIYGKEPDESEPDEMVPADESQCLCVLCGELFEDVYCQERDEWMFKGAIYMAISDTDGEMEVKDVSAVGGPIIHAKCLSESSISNVTKMEQDQ